MGGGDGNGNVMFTGYFSPVIELRHQPDEVFRYPVYGMPECEAKCPSRLRFMRGPWKAKGLS